MKKKSDETEVLLESILTGIFEKKGLNVLKFDLKKLENRVADYFIICHATTGTQVKSISESVEDVVRNKAGERPNHIEGIDNCFWVLLDYSNVIVHVFQEDYRSFYNLESFWSDASIESVEDNIQ